MSSDDCVGNDYISSSSSGYSDSFINFDYYDRYESGDNEDDRDDSSESYAYPVDSAQFEFDIKNYMDKIESESYHRLNGCAQSQTLKKQMDRVYPRYSVLFCIDTKVNKGDKSKITELGIAIYDPRRQELALTPHIKNIHILVVEQRYSRDDRTNESKKKDCSGIQSFTFTEKQTRSFLQRLVDHYFDPNFEIYCSLVSHDFEFTLRSLGVLGVNIMPNVRRLDTQILFALTHGHNKKSSLQASLEVVGQPYAFLDNAGHSAFYSVMLALKLCDPYVRFLVGMNERITVTSGDLNVILKDWIK
ncbi:hypothetical protein OXX59_003722 [Metschnikowia pulcherrima]